VPAACKRWEDGGFLPRMADSTTTNYNYLWDTDSEGKVTSIFWALLH